MYYNTEEDTIPSNLFTEDTSLYTVFFSFISAGITLPFRLLTTIDATFVSLQRISICAIRKGNNKIQVLISIPNK